MLKAHPGAQGGRQGQGAQAWKGRSGAPHPPLAWSSRGPPTPIGPQMLPASTSLLHSPYVLEERDSAQAQSWSRPEPQSQQPQFEAQWASAAHQLRDRGGQRCLRRDLVGRKEAPGRRGCLGT